MEYDYELIRSDRKTISLQIMPDGRLRVRCPRRMPLQQVQSFVCSKSNWIQKQLTALSDKEMLEPFSAQELRRLADIALKVIPERAAHYASYVGMPYGRITIRNQRTRWGSCSSKGNLSFNCLLMLAPPEVVDYVVVHELCHLKEMNHSKAFWSLVERILPNYQNSRKWLKDNGPRLIGRLNNR